VIAVKDKNPHISFALSKRRRRGLGLGGSVDFGSASGSAGLQALANLKADMEAYRNVVGTGLLGTSVALRLDTGSDNAVRKQGISN